MCPKFPLQVDCESLGAKIQNKTKWKTRTQASQRPRGKRPKREMKNGGGMLNCFFYLIICVCAIYHCQTTAAVMIMRNRFVTFNWLAFFRFHERLTQNYELKSGEKISSDEILEVKLALN